MNDNHILSELIQLSAAPICVIVNISIQICYARCKDGKSYLKSVAVGFITGILLLTAVELYLIFLQDADFLNGVFLSLTNLIIYFLISLGYFSFINVAVSAIRVRILSELSENPVGMMENEIYDLYNSEEIVDKRLGKLCNGGQISFDGKKYYPKISLTLIMFIILESIRFIVLNKRIRFSTSNLIIVFKNR
jgi:hypothetical protein